MPPSLSTSSPQRLWLPASVFTTVAGTPTLGLVGTYQAWLLDPAATETVATNWQIPASWNSWFYAIFYAATTAGGGNARLTINHAVSTAGSPDLSAPTSLPSLPITNTFTVPATANVWALSGNTSTTYVRTSQDFDVSVISMSRLGADGADTYAADMAFLGIELRRTS